ncbi:hypothetical protein [Pseudomonas sp. BN414]|uniref:hypothetical protein n=1 Tax=Pseudomonas sp. BN414 TaxID=2567888 RepID=UPI00245664D0|nr:hypothetical protein [Pseudomonas sp. BN414]
MTEPATTAAGGFALSKLLGLVLGVPLAVAVVMIMTRPRSSREWAVALISTVVVSIGGGAAVIQHYGLHEWAASFYGSLALASLHFTCGLPAWVLVRAWFIYAEKRRDTAITDMVKEIREAAGK